MAGIKVPLLVDKASGTKQVNDWLKQASEDAHVKAYLDFAEAKEGIASFSSDFAKLDEEVKNFSGMSSLDKFKAKAEQSEAELGRLRAEITQVEASLKGVNLDSLDLGQVNTLRAGLDGLKQQFKSTYAEATQAAENYEAAVEKDKFFSNDRIASMQKFAAGLGALKSLSDELGVSMLGLSEAQAKTFSGAAQAAQQGFQAGMATGIPEVALLTAGIGALVGGLNAWNAAAKAVLDAQIKLDNEGLARSSSLMEAQKATILTSTKAWQEYAAAVRLAGGVTASNLENTINVEQSLFDAEQAAMTKNLEAIKLKFAQGLGHEDLEQLREEQAAIAKQEEEIAKSNQRHLQTLTEHALPELLQIFDSTTEGTKKFHEELAKIGHVDTVKSLQQDLVDAQTELDKAEAGVEAVKKELAKPAPAGEGFLDYMTRLKKELIDSTLAAGLLSEAQAKFLTAKTAEVNGPKKVTKTKDPGMSIAEWNRQQDKETQDQANADLTKWAEEQLKIMDDERKAAADAQKAWDETVEKYDADKAQRILNATAALGDARFKALVEQHKAEAKLEADALAEQQKQFDEATKEITSGINSYLMPAVEAVTGQLYDNIEHGKKAFEGFGTAVKKGISEALKALGKQFAVQAIGEGAAGIASLALGPVGGISAAAHFAAAAGYGAAAVAAGVGAALLSRNAGSDKATSGTGSNPGISDKEDSKGGSGGGFSGGPLGSERAAFGTEVKAAMVVNVYGLPFGVATQRELAAIGGRINEAGAAYNNQGGSFAV